MVDMPHCWLYHILWRLKLKIQLDMNFEENLEVNLNKARSSLCCSKGLLSWSQRCLNCPFVMCIFPCNGVDVQDDCSKLQYVYARPRIICWSEWYYHKWPSFPSPKLYSFQENRDNPIIIFELPLDCYFKVECWKHATLLDAQEIVFYVVVQSLRRVPGICRW